MTKSANQSRLLADFILGILGMINKTVVFVHGVGPAKDGEVLQQFLAKKERQENQVSPLAGEVGMRIISGDSYPSVRLSSGLTLLESGWSQFRPVREGTFSVFFEGLALVWGMLKLATFDKFSVGSEARSKNTLGMLYVLSFLTLLFWCIHPIILGLFFATEDFTALFLWALTLGAVIWLLSRYDRIFIWGFVWLLGSLIALSFVSLSWIDSRAFIWASAWIYVFAQFGTITLGWLLMISQVWAYRAKPMPARAARLAIVFIPFFAASGIGALVWTVALARAQAVKDRLNGAMSFDEWAQVHSDALFYPVFNAEMYNGMAMFVVGCLLLIPTLISFIRRSTRDDIETAAATRSVFAHCLFLSGILVLVLIPLFVPAMQMLPNMSWVAPNTDTAGSAVFAAYATWSMRVLPFLPFFFGGLAIVLKIIGDIVFYLLPPSSRVAARVEAVRKLKKVIRQLLLEEQTVLVISHSQGTMISLDAVGELSRDGVSLDRVGLWLSGSPSVALYHDYLELDPIDEPLPKHLRNFFRQDDVIAGSIAGELSTHPDFSNLDFVEIRWKKGGHTNYWKDFELDDLNDALEKLEVV